MSRSTIIDKVMAWEWYFVCQRRRGDYKTAHKLDRCRLIIDRMELNGWLP